ncbi:menaquinone biosynthetic enzyme MqnA/MqnD family protein [Desulfurivibrio sp. D14AmB]|uniref:menaquinone biosynthetic enzyme MqnA/MqnD family protein n=1 Tax=Desulfurivibrio sp. D14AmB TaxID=3374370 RepID=UPI00376F2A77
MDRVTASNSPGAGEAGGIVRLGMVSFLNTAPLYETWKRTVAVPQWRVTEAPPATLNRLLYAGELDLGLVSSHEYASHPEQYRILSGLAIAATGAVGSVFIFSRFPLDQLDGRRLLLSSRSQTSVGLARILLEDRWRVAPRYRVGDYQAEKAAGRAGELAALLSIGDEALRLAASDEFPYRFDLAEIWHQWTGLPFVFAIWAVREEFWRQRPETAAAIHRELLRCQTEGLDDLPAICREVAPRIPLSQEACRRYLAGMNYDLNREQQAGLVRFFQLLIGRGEVPAAALPLKIEDHG